MAADVRSLSGDPLYIDPDRRAGIADICDRAKGLREIFIVGKAQDGELILSGSGSPAEALWLVEAARLWLLTGGELNIAHHSAAPGAEEEEGGDGPSGG